MALRRCDREEGRWAAVYAAEVIDLKQFQGYKAEIALRWQGLLAHQEECERRRSEAHELLPHGPTLIDYGARVRAHLKAFTFEEERPGFEALDLHITWTPGESLRIEGCIPTEPVMSIPSCWKFSGIG
jgi:hypothetical protein